MRPGVGMTGDAGSEDGSEQEGGPEKLQTVFLAHESWVLDILQNICYKIVNILLPDCCKIFTENLRNIIDWLRV